MNTKLKIILRLVFLFSFVIQITYSQSGWVKQNSGTTENLNTLYFTDDDNGFAAGDNGTLLRTIDGGTTWEIESSGTTNNLASISFVDYKNGFIVGADSTFLKTVDGGTTWLNLSDSLPAKFASVSFLDSMNGIAVEDVSFDTARVFKTTNGGFNWNYISYIEIIYMNPNFFPRFIKYLNNAEIIVTGKANYTTDVYKSTNGGLDWEWKSMGQGLGTGYRYNKTQFINSETGFLLANHGMTSVYHADFYITKNGGESWSRFTNYDLPACKTFFMVDENNGYMLGPSGYGSYNVANTIYKSTEGGGKWIKQISFSGYDFNDIFFTDTDAGFIIGDCGLILRTTTGGVKEEPSEWEIQKSGVTDNFRSVDLTEGNVGYCVGSVPLKTTNGGTDWQILYYDYSGFAQMEDISFIDLRNGIMVGTHNFIFKTSDGGNTWERIKFNDELWINALGVAYLDSLHTVVVGEDGKIRYTSDGGESWIKIESGTYEHLNEVFFLNNTLGFIAGNNGTILRSNNKGVTWESLESNTPNSLNSIYFISDEIGLAAGNLGTILRTSDGGESWQLQSSGSQNDLQGVYFRDEKNGLIVGELGVILRTSDGGVSWVKENSGVNNSLYGVALKDSVELVVGDEGIILRNIVVYEPDEPSDTNETIPLFYNLSQNYPNPFNSSTTIEYSLPEQSHVIIKVYDLLGREITTLLNEAKPAGNYSVNFDGSGLTSGVYFYRLSTGEFNETKKLLLLR